MLERICIKWDYPLSLEIENCVVKAGYFRESKEIILTDFSRRLKDMLLDYFEGKKVDFSGIKVVYTSNPLILKEVRKIPYGTVTTYGDIAKRLKTSPRAVGSALKSNRIPVIIPCHRVVAKNGLGGYSYGKDVKRKLLELENINL